MTKPKDTTESLERELTLYKCQGGQYELQNALTGELTGEYECYLRSDVDKVVRELTDKVNQYKTLFNEKCRDINTQEKLFAEQIVQLHEENKELKTKNERLDKELNEWIKSAANRPIVISKLREELAELREENKDLKEALERQQNAYLKLDEAYQRDTGIFCKAMNPGVPCAETKKVMEENESLKDELLDAKRDACRFEKAMYRALFNWAHVRTFVYMKEHGMLSLDITPGNLEIPPQWRRPLDLCKIGYEFAEIAQEKLPKKPKSEQQTTEV